MVGASFQPCIDSFVYFSLKMCMCVCTMQTLKLFQVISVFCFSFKDVRTREITLTTGSIVYLQFYIRRSHIPDTDTLKQFHHVEKNMLMRMKQFQCFLSVLFHHVRQVLTMRNRQTGVDK